MSKDIIITVGDREFNLPAEKEEELKAWLKENATVVIKPSDDLVIDIETTSGASIADVAKKSEEEKGNEARRKKSNE
jgi:hypothetical protein